MYPLTNLDENRVNPVAFRSRVSEPLNVKRLTAEDEGEVMAFLNERSIHTFGMAGFIRSNGVVSPHNQGEFYSCRDEEGELQGVALIGRYILVETRSGAAMEAFARIAQNCRNAHMLLGEQDQVATFWSYYADGGQSPRLYCREYLFELHWPVEVKAAVPGLRLATVDDLDLIVPAHAQIGRLIFKAEVVSDTPEIVYLEGIWVDPEERGRGIGSRCMSQLSRSFLLRSKAVCLLVNEKARSARAFYEKAGFEFISYYDTMYLEQQVH